MGMFDYINVEIECPECSATITNFQSKDAACLLDMIDPGNVDTFYSRCSCGHKAEFTRSPVNEPHRPEPFTEEELYALGFTKTN